MGDKRPRPRVLNSNVGLELIVCSPAEHVQRMGAFCLGFPVTPGAPASRQKRAEKTGFLNKNVGLINDVFEFIKPALRY